MASINDVFRQPEPGEPIVKLNLPKSKSELLARLEEAGFPFAAFLKEFHDNPESPVTKAIDKEAERTVPMYTSLIRPILKGEKPDYEMAAKEFALAGSQPGGPARALGSLPIKLSKSKLNYVVRPEKAEELLKLNAALREAVKKGEMTKADADKLLVNAATNIHEQSILEGKAAQGTKDLYVVEHPVPENPVEKSTVAQSDAKKYDDAFGIGNWIGQNLKTKDVGITSNGNPIYLNGDNGPLWINEHNQDAAQVRHNLSNYDKLVGSKKQGYGPALKYLYDRYPGENGYIQRLNLKDGGSKELYKTVVEPQALKQISGPKLGYNYKKAQNTSVKEGRKATTEAPNYKTVDELYKIILGLE